MIEKRNSIPWKLKQAKGMFQKGLINFDSIVQREGDQWSVYKKSLLMQSILIDFPIPAIFCEKSLKTVEGEKKPVKVYSVLDGRQRLSSIFDFMDDKFTLDFSLDPSKSSILIDSMFSIEDLKSEISEDNQYRISEGENGETILDIDGLLFSELPKSLQEDFSIQTLSFYLYSDLEFEDVEDLFYRLNNGEPLNKIQKLKAELGYEVLSKLVEIKKLDFFLDIGLTEAEIKKESALLYILQMLMTIEFLNSDMTEESRISTLTGFTATKIVEYGKSLRDKENFDELCEQLITVLTSETFADQYMEIPKTLRKASNLPLFVGMKYLSLDEDLNVEELTNFSNAVAIETKNLKDGNINLDDTENDKAIEFAIASGSGASNSKKVYGRLNILLTFV